MRILHNLDNSNRGGIQMMIQRLYTWSVHEHEFWAADGSMAPELRRAGMQLWDGGPPVGREYDVVIGHTVGGWSCNETAAWAHERGAKFIECMHSIAPSPTDPAVVDMFVAMSSLSAMQNQHMPSRRVIYPPVDVQAFLEYQGEHTLIGRASRLAAEKRPQVFAALAREFPAESFVMAGDGPERRNIQASDNLALPGWVFDLPKFYAGLKLFVLPTQDECNCVSIAQAQAACVPVICQDLPALRESTGGFATFCISQDDFAAAIRQALASPAGDVSQLAQAHQWARRMYDYPVSIGAWDSLCEELAA